MVAMGEAQPRKPDSAPSASPKVGAGLNAPAKGFTATPHLSIGRWVKDTDFERQYCDHTRQRVRQLGPCVSPCEVLTNVHSKGSNKDFQWHKAKISCFMAAQASFGGFLALAYASIGVVYGLLPLPISVLLIIQFCQIFCAKTFL